MHDLISLNEEVPTYIIGSEEKYYADLSRPVNMVKFYDMNRLVYELETFRGFNYPDSIVSSYESAVMFNLPLPAQPSSTHSNNSAHSTTIDYTSFVMTHIREWCILYLSEDKLLDKIVTL